MSSFTGSEVVAVDAKGRLVVPAKMRRGVSPEAADSFTLVRGPQGSVMMYPLDEWRVYSEHVRTSSPGDQRSMQFMRRMFASAHETTVDGQGRISVSPHLLQHAGVTTQAKLIGVIDHIELWNSERYEESHAVAEENYDESFYRMNSDVQANRKR